MFHRYRSIQTVEEPGILLQNQTNFQEQWLIFKTEHQSTNQRNVLCSMPDIVSLIMIRIMVTVDIVPFK